MDKLTPRQQQILQLIRNRIADTGMPPTRAEIANTFGFRSANAAEDHLKALARKGAIELLAGSSRGIRLLEPEGLPLIGRVAAGQPLLAQEHIEEHHKIDPLLFQIEDIDPILYNRTTTRRFRMPASRSKYCYIIQLGLTIQLELTSRWVALCVEDKF